MQDINKSRIDFRDSQMQIRGYISTFKPFALRPRLHLEGFSLSLQRNFTKKIIIYTRGGHKAN